MVLYSNGCPMCKKLKEKLDLAGIKYSMSGDFKEVIEAGFKTVPVLKTEDGFLDYRKAVEYLKGV
jgi:glutaredoxin